MGLDVPLRVWISRRMRDELVSAGPSTSAATRAYLLLGMAAAGVDLGPFRGEVAALLGEELLAALERCWAGRGDVRATERSAERCIPDVSQVYSNVVPTLPVPEPAAQTAWDDAYEV
jgi:hypothetical protein